MKCYLTTVLVITCTCYAFSLAALTLEGTKCGKSKFCSRQEYCSEFNRQCLPCSTICDNTTHNYDSALCIKQCQDYLHDLLYVRKDGEHLNPSSGEDLQDVVRRLQYTTTVSLSLTCITLIILAILIAFQIYWWKENNNVTLATLRDKMQFRKSDRNANKTVSNENEQQINGGKPDLRLDMPPLKSNQSDHSPVTTTTTITTRRPAEDSTLDYAYDNPAMSSTPSPNSKPPHESSF